jgi:hypothetical protein
MSDLLQHAIQYLSLGWSVIPVSVYKKPLVKWRHYQTQPPTVENMDLWFKALPVNKIARILGTVAGGIWVMDADGPEAVAWMDQNAPETPISVLSRRGKHNYYRAPLGVKIRNKVNAVSLCKDKNQIDIKGEGGQVIIPPSPHRDGEYQWVLADGYAIEDSALWDSLPVWELPVPRKIANRSILQDDTLGNLNLDLSSVAGKMGPDFRPAKDGERNSRLASLAGQLFFIGHDFETVLFMLKGWNLNNNPPLEIDEVEATVKSIYKYHFNKNSKLKTNIPRNVLISDVVEIDDINDIKLDSLTENDTYDDETSIPDYILQPGGLIQDIMNYADESTVSNFPLFTLGGALTLIGTLVGQKVITESGLRTNLYVITLSPSGTGKDGTLKTIQSLVREAECDTEILGGTNLASSASLIKSLEAKPCQLILFDEIGDLMGAFNNKFDANKVGLTKDLKSLYSSPESGFTKIYSDSNKNINIKWHCLSVYMTGVPSAMFSNLMVNDATDGLISRTIFMNANLKVKKLNKVNTITPNEKLVDDIKNLHNLPRIFKYTTGNIKTEIEQIPVPIICPKTQEAEDYFDKWQEKYIDLRNEIEFDKYYKYNKDITIPIYTRVQEIASKVALIVAISSNYGIPQFVDVKSVEYACKFVDFYIDKMIRDINTYISYNFQDSLKKRILKVLDKKGCISKTAIYNDLKECTHRQAEDVISILLNSGKMEQKIQYTKKGKDLVEPIIVYVKTY